MERRRVATEQGGTRRNLGGGEAERVLEDRRVGLERGRVATEQIGTRRNLGGGEAERGLEHGVRRRNRRERPPDEASRIDLEAVVAQPLGALRYFGIVVRVDLAKDGLRKRAQLVLRCLIRNRELSRHVRLHGLHKGVKHVDVLGVSRENKLHQPRVRDGQLRRADSRANDDGVGNVEQLQRLGAVVSLLRVPVRWIVLVHQELVVDRKDDVALVRPIAEQQIVVKRCAIRPAQREGDEGRVLQLVERTLGRRKHRKRQKKAIPPPLTPSAPASARAPSP